MTETDSDRPSYCEQLTQSIDRLKFILALTEIDLMNRETRWENAASLRGPVWHDRKASMTARCHHNFYLCGRKCLESKSVARAMLKPQGDRHKRIHSLSDPSLNGAIVSNTPQKTSRSSAVRSCLLFNRGFSAREKSQRSSGTVHIPDRRGKLSSASLRRFLSNFAHRLLWE